MPRSEYNKLVRDNIPDIIAAKGQAYEVIVMDEAEFRHALQQKLIEEAQEVLEAASDELIKELADVYEVLDALIAAYGLSKSTIREKQHQRREQRGGFTKRLKLIWAEI